MHSHEKNIDRGTLVLVCMPVSVSVCVHCIYCIVITSGLHTLKTFMKDVKDVQTHRKTAVEINIKTGAEGQ